MLNPKAAKAPKVDAADTFVTRLSTDTTRAKWHLAKAQERQTRYANKRCRRHPFKVGVVALLNTKNLSTRPEELAEKLKNTWEGPFGILRSVVQIGPTY